LENAGNRFYVFKAVSSEFLLNSWITKEHGGVFSIREIGYTCAGGKYTHLTGSWASSEDKSYTGPSSSSCKVLEDAEDGS